MTYTERQMTPQNILHRCGAIPLKMVEYSNCVCAFVVPHQKSQVDLFTITIAVYALQLFQCDAIEIFYCEIYVEDKCQSKACSIQFIAAHVGHIRTYMRTFSNTHMCVRPVGRQTVRLLVHIVMSTRCAEVVA